MLDSEQLSHHGVWRKSAHKAGAWQRPFLGGAGSRFPPRRGCLWSVWLLTRGPAPPAGLRASSPQQPRPAPLLPVPACPCASPSEVHTRTFGAEVGDWHDRPLTNGREILTPRGKRLHPQETMAFAFSPIQHPGNSIFPTDQCGRGLRVSSG